MNDQPTTAAPALAAHSKDASTPSPNPASSATGVPGGSEAPAAGSSPDVEDVADQVAGYVRSQPMTALAVTAGLFFAFGLLLGRR